MELYNGRPEDTSGRKEKEIKVYDILDSLHIPCLLYTSPSPRDTERSRMPSSA